MAVIGAGMVGRAHANAYRQAGTVYGPGLPEIRLAAIADTYEPFAAETARRFGYQRAETSWQAVAAAPDVDVVSVAVANALHREVVEGLLAAGKHVLCEKPLAPSVADGEAMVAAAEASDRVAAIGLTFRRSPAINAVREEVRGGVLGPVQHFTGRYWCDYGADPDAPISWRYRGGPGSGALADIGSHLVDLGEFFCGPAASVAGTTFLTAVKDRPVPLGVAVGHAAGVAVGAEREPVQNEDVATFTVTFAGGAVGTFAVSRIAHGHANTLTFEVACERGRRVVHPGPAGRVHPRRRRRPPHQSSVDRRTRTWPAASRWTSRASATGRTTSSSSRPARSWSRSPAWPGCRRARRWPRACTTCGCSPPSPTPRPPAAPP